jgi:hypothetical protein
VGGGGWAACGASSAQGRHERPAAAADLRRLPEADSPLPFSLEHNIAAGFLCVLQLDGGAILSSAAADFGLGAAAAAAEVEAVRAQDWEQSIKVWRPWGCAAPLPSWAELRCWRRRQAPSACACGQLLLVSSFFTLVHRRTATSLLRWGRGCGSFPSGASRPTRQPPTYCWSRVRRRAGPAVPKLCCCSGGACAWLACWLRLLALLAGADATLPPVAML